MPHVALSVPPFEEACNTSLLSAKWRIDLIEPGIIVYVKCVCDTILVTKGGLITSPG